MLDSRFDRVNRKVGPVARIDGQSERNRARWRLSQEEFADRCGLHRTYMGAFERGERNVSLVNLEKIARAFKIALSELFRGV